MDVLSDILRTVKVQGSLYFRTAFSPPWGLRVPAFRNVSRFHLVTRGNCAVRISGIAEKIRLETGDLIVITRGAEHHLSDAESQPPFASVDEAVGKSGFDGNGAFVWGGDDTSQKTALICGHFAFHSERGKLLLEALPPYIHVPNSEILHYGWLEAATKFISHEAFYKEIGNEAIINRLAEIIFIQTVRTYAKMQGETRGLFAALADAQINRVLQAIHHTPGEKWTVDSLAKTAGVSRTILAERMKDILGISPIAYLTRWRMDLAHEALSGGQTSVGEISNAVGYESLSAFTRTFKKHFDYPPGEVFRRKQLGIE